jgi:hypothetical protein
MRRIARAGKTVGKVALIALYAGPSLQTQLVWLGEVSYDGLRLACGTAPDFLFRVLKWRGYPPPKHEFRNDVFMSNDRFGSA